MSERIPTLDELLQDEAAMFEAAYERMSKIVGGLRDILHAVINGPDDDSTLRPRTS